jgi:DNA-binding transcriptional LysR family regulator
MAKFADQHPKLRIEFALDDARHDLIGDSVDVAVRIGMLNDSTAVAQDRHRSPGSRRRAVLPRARWHSVRAI